MGEPSLAEQFEEHRTRLRGLAYRMLGSLAEADEAVQDAWLRLSRMDAGEIGNLGGLLTTVVARICLNILQARKVRSVSAATSMPDPIITPDGYHDPEHEVLLADSVGLALQIILDTLPAAERLAFVLHDMFDMPFDEIAAITGRSPTAARQLASRARRRVKGAAVPTPEPDLARQREVVDAFFAAAQKGDFNALVAVLDPEVVARYDDGQIRRGAEEVARGALAGATRPAVVRSVLVNGAAGAVVLADSRLHAVMAFTVARGKIVEIDLVLDPDRLARLDLDAFGK